MMRAASTCVMSLCHGWGGRGGVVWVGGGGGAYKEGNEGVQGTRLTMMRAASTWVMSLWRG